MRSIAAGFRTWLQALAPVTSAGAKVHLSRIPETERLPCLTVNRAGGDPLQTLADDDDSLLMEDFELRAWAGTGKAADELMNAVIEELEDFEGNMGNDRRCEAVIFEGMPTLDVGDVDFGDQVLRHVAAVTVTLQHSPQA
jgi:hypothetical protein